MKITKAIREVESHVKKMVSTPAEQIDIVSTAQGMITHNAHDSKLTEKETYSLNVLIIIKRRIIREMEGTK